MKNRRSIARSGTAFEAFSSHAELYAMGKRLREKCPFQSHAIWKPARDRPDPLRLSIDQHDGARGETCKIFPFSEPLL